MSDMNTARDKAADEADERWQKENYDGGYDTLSFKEGWDACLAEVKRRIGEVDHWEMKRDLQLTTTYDRHGVRQDKYTDDEIEFIVDAVIDWHAAMLKKLE